MHACSRLGSTISPVGSSSPTVTTRTRIPSRVRTRGGTRRPRVSVSSGDKDAGPQRRTEATIRAAIAASGASGASLMKRSRSAISRSLRLILLAA